MFSEKFHDVLSHQGVVAIVSWADGDAHVVNTWNKFLTLTDDERLLVPAAGMQKTEKNISQNNRVKLTLGSSEVMGNRGMGTGFYIEGTAKFLQDGPDFEMMKEKYPFLSRVLEITTSSCTQTL